MPRPSCDGGSKPSSYPCESLSSILMRLGTCYDLAVQVAWYRLACRWHSAGKHARSVIIYYNKHVSSAGAKMRRYGKPNCEAWCSGAPPLLIATAARSPLSAPVAVRTVPGVHQPYFPGELSRSDMKAVCVSTSDSEENASQDLAGTGEMAGRCSRAAGPRGCRKAGPRTAIILHVANGFDNPTVGHGEPALPAKGGVQESHCTVAPCGAWNRVGVPLSQSVPQAASKQACGTPE